MPRTQAEVFMHHSISDRDPAFFFFVARQSPVWTSASSKALSQANTASNSTEGANLLFPSWSLSVTWISCSHSDEFSPFSFILSRSDRRNTCGIHPLKKRKKTFYTFLFFLYFVPPFHLYLAKVKKIFFKFSSSITFPVLWSCVSSQIAMQKSKAGTTPKGLMLHLCPFLHPHIALSLRAGGVSE